MKKGSPALKQGLYKMSLHDYHHGKGAFAESKSTLANMISFPDGCPYYYKWEKDHPKEEVKQVWDEGTALHAYFQGEAAFNEMVEVKEVFTGKGSREKNKNEIAKIREAGKVPINDEFLEKLQDIDEALHCGRFEKFRKILENPKNIIEQSGFWQDEKTGIWLKTRPDIIAPNGVLWDIKKHEDIKSFEGVASDKNYDLQAYMALIGMSQITGVEHKLFGFLVFHTRTQPYEFEVRPGSDLFIESGQKKFDEVMGLLAHGLKHDEWPGKTEDEIKILNPSSYRMKEMGIGPESIIE